MQKNRKGPVEACCHEAAAGRPWLDPAMREKYLIPPHRAGLTRADPTVQGLETWQE